MSASVNPRIRIRCPHCRERFDSENQRCYCEELDRRQAYDKERESRGLVALYRPRRVR